MTSLLTEDEDEDEENEEEEAYTEIWGRDARGRYATEDDSEFEKEFIEEDDEEIDQLDLPCKPARRVRHGRHTLTLLHPHSLSRLPDRCVAADGAQLQRRRPVAREFTLQTCSSWS